MTLQQKKIVKLFRESRMVLTEPEASSTSEGCKLEAAVTKGLHHKNISTHSTNLYEYSFPLSQATIDRQLMGHQNTCTYYKDRNPRYKGILSYSQSKWFIQQIGSLGKGMERVCGKKYLNNLNTVIGGGGRGDKFNDDTLKTHLTTNNMLPNSFISFKCTH